MKSIDLGCQAFIISYEVFEDFLHDFHEVHDQCIQVFFNKHVVTYSQSSEKNSTFDEILHYPAIEGKNCKIEIISKIL